MEKKNAIVIGILIITAIIIVVVFVLQKREKVVIEQKQQVKQQLIQQEQDQDRQNKQQPQQKETLDDLTNSAEEMKLPEMDTSNWQTYRNEKYGFEMKIPKDWYVEIPKDEMFCLKSKTRLFYFEGEKGVCGISLDASYFDRYFKSGNEFANLVRKLQEQGIITKMGYILIDNKKSLYFNWSTAEVIAIIYDENKIWNMVIQGADSSISPVFYGIVQTFHFVEK